MFTRRSGQVAAAGVWARGLHYCRVKLLNRARRRPRNTQDFTPEDIYIYLLANPEFSYLQVVEPAHGPGIDVARRAVP